MTPLTTRKSPQKTEERFSQQLFAGLRVSASRPEVFGQATLAAVSSGEPRRSRAFR